MSTKMLRGMLSQYEDMIGSSTSEIGMGAKKELEDIEKAAVEWVVSDVGELSQEATDTLCNISNEVIARREAAS